MMWEEMAFVSLREHSCCVAITQATTILLRSKNQNVGGVVFVLVSCTWPRHKTAHFMQWTRGAFKLI